MRVLRPGRQGPLPNPDDWVTEGAEPQHLRSELWSSRAAPWVPRVRTPLGPSWAHAISERWVTSARSDA